MKEIRVGRMLEIEGEVSEIEELKDSLFLSSIGAGKQFFIKLYEELDNPKRLLIPRARIKTSLVIKGSWKKIPVNRKSNIKLKTEQKPIVNTFLERLISESRPGGIIKAVTGSGKTVMAIDILFTLGYKTLIIVPTTQIMLQWLRQMKMFSNLRQSEIGYIRQNICDIKNKSIVVAMLHTLTRGKYTEIIQKEFGTVIFDEVHLLGAETFSRVASLLDCKYRIGLSATPRRKDGMESVFTYHIGRVLSEYTKIKEKPKIILVNYNGRGASHEGCFWNKKLSLGKFYNRLTKLKDRNFLVAKYIKEAYKQGRYILVLTERIKQIEDLKVILKLYKVPKLAIGVCTAKEKQLDKRIIIGTYGSASFGMDIPELDCLILATPRVDLEQAIGRLMREKEGKKKPIVIDIIDTTSSIMVGWSKARQKYYRRESFEVITKAGG